MNLCPICLYGCTKCLLRECISVDELFSFVRSLACHTNARAFSRLCVLMRCALHISASGADHQAVARVLTGELIQHCVNLCCVLPVPMISSSCPHREERHEFADLFTIAARRAGKLHVLLRSPRDRLVRKRSIRQLLCLPDHRKLLDVRLHRARDLLASLLDLQMCFQIRRCACERKPLTCLPTS